MKQPLLAYTLWLSWTQDQRSKLTRLFNIPRTGESVVHVGEMQNGNISGVAKQDGHSPQDLYAITTEKLQDLIETIDTDFYHMIQHVIDNLDDLYYEKFPDEKPVPQIDLVADSVSVDPTPEQEVEFVPRDPEELLKKKSKPEEITTPNESEHAPTKKGRPAKTK